MKMTILTQNRCPKCDSLKLYLDTVLEGKYEDQIEWVNRESDPERFGELVQKHNIMATPSAITEEGVFRGVSPTVVQALFEQGGCEI